jgi:hypothetical protein
MARYLFIVQPGSGFLIDDACSGTTAWTDDLAFYRPPDVSPAPAVVGDAPLGPFDRIDAVPVAALLAALVIAVVSYVFILRARRRPPDWRR